jgi:Uma2 family endonuclease
LQNQYVMQTAIAHKARSPSGTSQRLPQRKRFTVAEYKKMARLGIIPERGAELLNGDVMFGTRRKRFSIEEYYTLANAGILPTSTRTTELLDGDVLCMSPIGSPHFATVAMVQYLLHQALGSDACIAVQSTMLLPTLASAPEPDIAILRFRPDFYRFGLPTPNDALLIIEVADSTLKYDSGVKADRYAKAGVSELWIIDIKKQRLEVCRKPSAKGYQERYFPANADIISIAALPQHTFSVAMLVGAEYP